ncbi:MAG: EAL domain-containing protein [Clostridia bacterium]|nr:EAL domain-containing protein [Clostridia bacterium]
MKRTTINRKLLKLNISIVSLALVLVATVIIFIIRDNAEKQFIDRSASILNYSSQQLNLVFNNAEKTIDSLESFYLEKSREETSIEQMLHSLQTGTSIYQHMFLVYKNGRYLVTPVNGSIPSDFDPRNRAWYQDAVSNFGEFVWSDPYLDIDTNKLVITCSKVFRDPYSNENVVVGLDMTIDELNDMIMALSSSNFGYMMLVNSNDIIILHSSPDEAHNRIQAYGDDLLTAEFHAGTPIYRTNSGIFMQETLSNREMYLIRYFSYKDLTRSIMPFGITFTGIIGFFMMIAIGASFNLSRRITTPLMELKDTMAKGLSTNLLKPCDFTTNDEIGELIEGYNFLVSDINEKTLEMTALYEELTASEETLQEQYDQLYENREQIKMSEEKYRLISEASTQGLMELYPNNELIFHSRKWFEQFDMPNRYKELNDWLALIIEEDLAKVKEALMDHFNKKTAIFNEEYRIKTTSENVIWLSSIGQAQFDGEGHMTRMIISNNDITKRKTSEAEIRTMAYTDGLTGLLNRTRLKDVITKSMEQHEQGTMFYINLDNFKSINDTYGHSYGDRVLIELSQRLKDCAEVNCKTARISGDEFTIVAIDTLSISNIEDRAKTIINKISEKIIIDNIEIYITASVGAASYPYDADTFEELMINADLSMHKAKAVGKERYVIFTESIKEEMLLSMKIERHLSQALNHNEISIHYQPVVRVSNNKIVGFEALARWHNLELGHIPPDTFIPIAEKNKLIIPLGNYIMRQSLEFILDLNKEFGTDYEVALNISAIQLQQANYCQTVLNLAKELDYPLQCLNLEVTESMELESDPIIIENIQKLSEAGIPISLDDFGTGYSTFKNLIELPFDHLKLDKGIVQRSVIDDHVYKLISSVVEFSHKMNIRVIAEGIEDLVMVERMNKLDVDFLQGYMYSKPVDGPTLRKLIAGQQL